MKHLTFCALLGLGMHMLGFGQTYSLTVESSVPAAAPGTVYRFYVNSNDPTDKISAVFGNDQDTLAFSTPEGIFNSALNSAWNASGINQCVALFAFFPDLQDDSYATKPRSRRQTSRQRSRSRRPIVGAGRFFDADGERILPDGRNGVGGQFI